MVARLTQMVQLTSTASAHGQQSHFDGKHNVTEARRWKVLVQRVVFYRSENFIYQNGEMFIHRVSYGSQQRHLSTGQNEIQPSIPTLSLVSTRQE